MKKNSRNDDYMIQPMNNPLQAMELGTGEEKETTDGMINSRITNPWEADRKIQFEGSRERKRCENETVSRREASNGVEGVGSIIKQRNPARHLHLQDSSLCELPPVSPLERDSAEDESEPRSANQRKEYIEGNRICCGSQDKGTVSRCEAITGEEGVGSIIKQRNPARPLLLQDSSHCELPPASSPVRPSAKVQKEQNTTDQRKEDRQIQFDESRELKSRDNGKVSRCEVSGGDEGVGSIMKQRNPARPHRPQDSSLCEPPPASPPKRDCAKDRVELSSSDPRKVVHGLLCQLVECVG